VSSPASRALPRAVWILGLTSLLTDASSEMIYPLLPLYLSVVLHAGPAFLGAIEGAADTTASLLKLVSGVWADRVRRRKPLVVLGYALSSLARPLVAIAVSPAHVLAVRVTDRIGKGIRSSPRDAVIADVTPAASRGRAYGLHRAMDHAGAVVGPVLAAVLLFFLGEDPSALRTVFALAAIPGAAAVLVLVFGLREPPRELPGPKVAAALPAKVRLPADLHRLLAIVFVFSLGNSSDAFLLLRANDVGVPAMQLPILWVVHHVVKSALSGPLGGLSDRIGRRAVIIAGWLVYAASYALFALTTGPIACWAVFCLYGVHFALTEGAVRALVADLAPAEARGRAFGLYHAVVGVGALPASLVFGAIWQAWSAEAALGTGAGLSLVAALALGVLIRRRPPGPR
jgi:MFS family permease